MATLKIIRRGWFLAQRAVAFLFDACVVLLPPRKMESPVVFLIGPPRSGSTLVMQVITDAFEVGYLSNRHCLWFSAPAVAEYCFRPLTKKQRSSFVSIHGSTEGNCSPSECGAWWYRFFPRSPAYARSRDVSNRKMLAFRRSLNNLSDAFDLPLVFKNLYASLRIEPIAHHIPGALFVVIDRDRVDNAQSILKARKDALGRYDQWWSVPSPNAGELAKLSPVLQVLGQIQSIHDVIDEDVQRLGLEDRTFRIRYEDFCNDVHGALDLFEAFMKRHGINLERRFEVPSQFTISRSVKIPGSMYEEIRYEMAKCQERKVLSGSVAREY